MKYKFRKEQQQKYHRSIEVTNIKIDNNFLEIKREISINLRGNSAVSHKKIPIEDISIIYLNRYNKIINYILLPIWLTIGVIVFVMVKYFTNKLLAIEISGIIDFLSILFMLCIVMLINDDDVKIKIRNDKSVKFKVNLGKEKNQIVMLINELLEENPNIKVKWR